ncbi:DUF1211 domain-containing protein [Muricauda sp. NFXS6]|uniref:TMEM175 family protein n=1 Tax=Allomuricauda sp. NFXS6 TaxID=2819094 RepID=UPI0032E04C2D
MKLPHNISRIEAFSDGVFAFAATLLVVSVGTQAENSILQVDWMMFLSFGVSFFALVGLWSVHYNFFRRTNYMDNMIIALNAILLFLILYYIFPIKSLINSWTGTLQINADEFSSLFQLYSLGFLLIFTCYALMYWRVYKKANNSNMQHMFYARHFGLFVIVALVSIIIARLQLGLNYGLPGIIYMLLGPFCYFHAVYFQKKTNAF